MFTLSLFGAIFKTLKQILHVLIVFGSFIDIDAYFKALIHFLKLHLEKVLLRPTLFVGRCYFFYYQGFLSQTMTVHGIAGKETETSLFLFTIFTRSRTFRHLFASLHVRWLPPAFNCIACNCQTAIDKTCHLGNLPFFDWLTMQCWFLFTWRSNSRFLLR